MIERNGVRGLRVMSLAIALLLWIFVTTEKRGEVPSEKVVDAPVTYNPPPGMIILNPRDRVRVRVRGGATTIRHVNPYTVDVQVELPHDATGKLEVRIDQDNVLVPEGVEVLSIEPSSLELQLDREVRRLLPVRVRLTGEPAAGAVVSSRPEVQPDQVLAVGPQSLVSSLDHLETSPINLDGHAFDFEESALVASPDPLVKVQSQVVTVRVPMRQPGPVGEKGGGP